MTTKQINVLIIEDNDDIREGTKEILELTGYHVYTAPEGKTGVDMALKHLPDIILCDIMMPELDGFGVLYMLSKHPEAATIPFIFLTAKAERADMRKAMEMGADDYLTKPFDDIELLNAIETRLKKRKQLGTDGGIRKNLYLSDEEQETLLKELVQGARVKTYRKKQFIYQERDMPLYVYYVKKGKVRNFLYYLDGRELSTDIHVPDSFFGYESLLLQQHYNDNAETLEETELALIDKEQFFELLYRKPGIATKFIKWLSGTIRGKEDQLLAFAYDSVRKRVANALINVAEKTVSGIHEDECLIRISRDDLASLAGTANETISRMLADFKDEKLIAKEGNAIRILSIHKLRNIKQ
ncbi:response regulator [Parapedobacter sp. ISTM3]|uniref:Crp-like helix-turn-helix domain-containing protein n=1 Tax=Parapedobacter luteus TaxID=623280 RepID=A0A1T5BCQ6_9SPHI|nr:MULTISPECIES: response regulator [Parapedobacter]MBK1439585.1 response regulator [Parapedobacter sp. ISTM3]SKB45101.1 Crp-like helix-turn-helix domain-containing protein [Parapedobacter luteus]